MAKYDGIDVNEELKSFLYGVEEENSKVQAKKAQAQQQDAFRENTIKRARKFLMADEFEMAKNILTELEKKDVAAYGDEDDARVYWNLMLADVKAECESDLEDKNIDISSNKYFKLAIGTAEGDDLDYYLSLKKKLMGGKKPSGGDNSQNSSNSAKSQKDNGYGGYEEPLKKEDNPIFSSYIKRLPKSTLDKLEGTDDELYFVTRKDRRNQAQLADDFAEYFSCGLFDGYQIKREVSPTYFGCHPKCRPAQFLFSKNGKDLLAVHIIKDTSKNHPAIKSVKEACQKRGIKYLHFIVSYPNKEHYVNRKALEELGEITPFYGKK